MTRTYSGVRGVLADFSPSAAYSITAWCSLSSFQFAKSFLSAVRLGRHTLWQVLACVSAFVRLANVCDCEGRAIYNESIKSLILSHVHTLVLTPTMFVRSSVYAQIPRIFFFSSLAHSISHF